MSLQNCLTPTKWQHYSWIVEGHGNSGAQACESYTNPNTRWLEFRVQKAGLSRGCNVSPAELFVLNVAAATKTVLCACDQKWSEKAEMQTRCLAKVCTKNHTVPLICINTRSAVPLCPTLKWVDLADAEHFGPKINDWLCSCLIRLEVLCPGWREGLNCQLITTWWWFRSDGKEGSMWCAVVCVPVCAV